MCTYKQWHNKCKLGLWENNIGAPIVNRLHYTATIVNRLYDIAEQQDSICCFTVRQTHYHFNLMHRHRKQLPHQVVLDCYWTVQQNQPKRVSCGCRSIAACQLDMTKCHICPALPKLVCTSVFQASDRSQPTAIWLSKLAMLLQAAYAICANSSEYLQYYVYCHMLTKHQRLSW